MKKLKDGKAVYNAIKIPSELDYVVNKAVSNGKQKKRFEFRYMKYVVSTVSCVFLTFVLMVNVNSSFASTVSEIPILGDVARVFTISEYQEEDEEKLVNAKIPALENSGNTDLEKRINYEIMLKMNEVLDEAEERATKYKEAVIETGGEAEDYQPINIQIDYKVGFSNSKVVSFVILKSETLASAYTEMYFYNIDLEVGKKLNLKDIFGNDYRKEVRIQKMYILLKKKEAFRELRMNIKIFISIQMEKL